MGGGIKSFGVVLMQLLEVLAILKGRHKKFEPCKREVVISFRHFIYEAQAKKSAIITPRGLNNSYCAVVVVD